MGLVEVDEGLGEGTAVWLHNQIHRCDGVVIWIQIMGAGTEGSLSKRSQVDKLFIRTGQDSRECLSYLQNRQTHKPYLLRQITYNSPEEQQQMVLRLMKRDNVVSPALTNLSKYETTSQDNLCSNYHRVYSLWQYPNQTLAQEINQRALLRKPFSNEELTNILKHMVEGLKTLEQHNIPHQCLTTKTLLVEYASTGTDLSLRVVDPLAIPVHANLDLVYHKRNIKHVYLSPTQCDLIRQQNLYGARVEDPYRDDVFVGGVIMLECCSLERQDECYLQESARVDFGQIDRRVKRVQQEHGQNLARAIGWMLQQKTQNRPDWIQLADAIQKESAVRSISDKNPALELSQEVEPVIKVQQVPISPKTQIYNQSFKSSNIPNHMASVPRESIDSARYSHATNARPMEQSVIPNEPKASVVPQQAPFSQRQSLPVSQQVSVKQQPIQRLIQEQQREQQEQAAPKKVPPPIQSVLASQIAQNVQVEPQTYSSVDAPTSARKQPESASLPPTSPKGKMLFTYYQTHPDPTAPVTAPPLEGDFRAGNSPSKQVPKTIQSQIQVEKQKHSVSINPVPTPVPQPEPPISSAAQSHPPLPPRNSNNQTTSLPQPIQQVHEQQKVQTVHERQRTSSQLNRESIRSNQPLYAIDQYPQGRRYEGYKVKGKKEGEGRFYLNDRLCFEGYWRNDLMQGRGRLYYESGRLAYQGFFYQNKFHGHGVLYNEHPEPLATPFNHTNFEDIEQFWTVYEGQFINDMKEGRGKLTLSNGQYFEGTFLADAFQGQGRFYSMGGDTVHGLWQANKLAHVLP